LVDNDLLDELELSDFELDELELVDELLDELDDVFVD
jgi:hypothetical protein